MISTTDPLDAATAPAADDLTALHQRLAARAEADGLLAVAYRHLDTPIGTLLLAATDRGLVRVAFEVEDEEQVLAELADAISPRILRAPRRLDAAARELDEYFDRRRTTFELALDHALSSGFRDTVQRALTTIPYGETASYGQLAERVGKPGAARAVGSACATNPLPIVQPCHRVVRSDGSSGNYRGRPLAKATLLRLESGEPG